MQILVGTEPVKLPIRVGETAIIQNLGPGTVGIDFDSDVSVLSGLQVKADAAYELPGDLSKALYAVATEESTDVRILVVA